VVVGRFKIKVTHSPFVTPSTTPRNPGVVWRCDATSQVGLDICPSPELTDWKTGGLVAIPPLLRAAPTGLPSGPFERTAAADAALRSDLSLLLCRHVARHPAPSLADGCDIRPISGTNGARRALPCWRGLQIRHSLFYGKIIANSDLELHTMTKGVDKRMLNSAVMIFRNIQAWPHVICWWHHTRSVHSARRWR
jgi:hypothetical protein